MESEFWSIVALIGLAVWIGLLLFRGGFWRADQRLPHSLAVPTTWPEIVAVIPARDEAQTIADAVRSLTAQEYGGRLSVIVVDDRSSDETAVLARSAGAAEVVEGCPLPPGWTGKMWAVAQGLDRAAEIAPDSAYVLLTDADIAHGPDSLRRLVAKAEADGLDLVSLMVTLRCISFWERFLIPAFVFFFQKLYPFPWINDPGKTTAGAAGGCMLVRRTALDRIGGVASIRNRVIDDCALAAAIKPGGPIWLGLAEESRSLRGYDGLDGIWDMVARTAYVQLDNSPLLLFGTVAGMALMYLAPPLALIAGLGSASPVAAIAGGLGWLVMSAAYVPTLRLYRQPIWKSLFLPLAAALYTAMTFSSAWRTWRGRGAAWKGRSYGHAAKEGE